MGRLDEIKMIKSLTLQNFQKHAQLSVDFTKGVNVIYGKSDLGKSCLRRALSWIFFNEPKGDVIRKTGTKKTSAKVTLDNGVQVERIKSNSANAYILYINGEKRRFDAIGKGIPDEVQKVLKMTPISVDNDKLVLNVANQIALPFLLDKSATFRSKLFNQLTGADVVDKALQSLNKDILRVNRETKTEEDSVKEKTAKLKELTKEKNKVEKVYKKVSQIYTVICDKKKQLEKLQDYLKQLDTTKKEIKRVDEDLKKIVHIDEKVFKNLNDKIEQLNSYSQLIKQLKINKQELEAVSNALKELKIPELPNKLREKAVLLGNLKELKIKLEDLQKLREQIVNNIVKQKSLIEQGQIEYKEILKKYGRCPVCQGEITESCLQKIKL